MLKHLSKVFAALLLAGLLSACDSSEERAEQHFLKSAELYQAGDVARAVIELRNVFQLNGAHLEARLLMAKIEEERDNPAGAYDQYSAATESHPEHLEAQRAAARLAADIGNWEAAERHANAARALLADGQSDPMVHAVELGVAYQKARQAQDLAAAKRISEEAETLLDAHPELMIARRILIYDQVLRQDWEAALAVLDIGLEQRPDDRQFYWLRLSVLEQLGRNDAIEAQLREMVDRFQDDGTTRQMLVRWYVSQQRTDDAETYLRNQIKSDDLGSDSRMTLISFLVQLRGPEAALAETDRILATLAEDDPNRALYRASRASLFFGVGDHQKAIAEMHDILEGTVPSDQESRLKIALAKMLTKDSNPVGARALVEEVLEKDPTYVDALKMRASWLIDDDRSGDALAELRRALDQEPRDAETLTLMARAQERAGSRELMGEMLARAVEASGNAPAESLRYAALLVQEDRLLPAEAVLLDALRLQQGNVQILAALGNLYVRLEDWGRLQGVIDALQTGQENPVGTGLADELTARMLAAQNRQGELQSFLEQLAGSEVDNNNAAALAIRLRLSQGDTAGALDYLNGLLSETPDDPDLRMIEAAILAIDGKSDEALASLRKILEEDARNERAWLALYNLHRSMGNEDEARKVLTEALEALPDSTSLNWAMADDLERKGNVEGAIAIYERMYQQNSDSAVIANNLASLISSFREDPESLQRAFAIARRLRGTDVPQFQDTYGWIAARLGNHDEALEYLEPSAEMLPQDPTVRYHLARTYAMAGRDTDALAAYRATRDLLADRPPLPFYDEVIAAIARLETALPAQD